EAETRAGPPSPYAVHVVDATSGAYLEAAELRGEDGALLGTTDEGGRWRAENVAAKLLVLTASKTGYTSQRIICEPRTTELISLYLGVRVEGLVRDARTEEPVADAQVRVWNEDYGREVTSATTDEQGRFDLPAVRPHTPLWIVVAAPGRVPRHQRAMFDLTPPKSFELTIGGGGRLDVRVVADDEKPRAGVRVELVPAERAPIDLVAPEPGPTPTTTQIRRARSTSALTDADGRCSFVDVQFPDAWRPVAVLGPRHVVAGPELRLTEEDQVRNVTLVVTKPGTIEVALRDGAGEAVGHAEVQVVHEGRLILLGPDVPWSRGVLRLEGLSPGTYDIEAHIPGREVQRGQIELRAGRRELLELTFPGGDEIAGTVRDRAGAPIAKAEVSWFGAAPYQLITMRTDDRGRFRILGVQSATGTLQVAARDLPHTSMKYDPWSSPAFRVGRGPVEIVLEDGPVIIGRVVAAPPGAEITCCILVSKEREWRRVQPDEEGAFRIQGPYSGMGHLQFIFETAGFVPIVVEDRTAFRPSEVRDVGTLFFQQTNPRRGIVLGPDGAPAHGARVRTTEPWTERSTRTNEAGEFMFASLPDVPVRLYVDAEDGYHQSVILSTESQFRPQTIQLLPGRPVLVRVVDRRRRPVAGAHVILRATQEHSPRADPAPERLGTTDARGSAEFTLSDGTYDILVLEAGDSGPGTHHKATVGGKPGGSASVFVELKAR
ncbi:MAG: carboxypeptidase-like regulatory domain-containing protein, partial [Planctomycetota bacterium]|nr:carboxypeptidase-like regulatory domain-containing protein [Planctomycetota bacterium]